MNALPHTVALGGELMHVVLDVVIEEGLDLARTIVAKNAVA